MAEAQASGAELDELTVLMVGEGETLSEGVREALQRRGLTVLTSPTVGSTQAAIAIAPDLMLLVGDAASDGGHEVLGRLAASPLAAVVPVVILADDAALDDRLRAFRFGAAAVVPRSASVDAIAGKVAQLAQEIPERASRASGELGSTTLDDFVQLLSHELRAGILSVKPKGRPRDDTVRIVLGEGRTVADVVEKFVAQVRPLVQEAEVVRYEFHEQPGGTIALLGADDDGSRNDRADIRQMRVLLADDDVTRADAVAQELRERGANVVMTDLAGTRIERARDLDPAVLIIGDAELRGAGYQLVRRMREDRRLRWAFLLVVQWDDVWSPDDPAPLVDRIVNKLFSLAETERTLRARAQEGEPFDTRLEVVGPARLLRALAHGKGTFRALVHNRRAQIRVDFAQGLIAGAVAEVRDGEKKLYGPAALAAVLSVASGKVRIEPVASPAAANIMATVDAALSTAEAEEPPLRPSTIVKQPAGAERVGFARYTPAEPMPALGKNQPAATRKGISVPRPKPEHATKTGIAAPPSDARRPPPKPFLPPKPGAIPPPKVTLAGLPGKAPAWKPAPPRTDPTLPNPIPPPGTALDTTEPTTLPEARPPVVIPDTTEKTALPEATRGLAPDAPSAPQKHPSEAPLPVRKRPKRKPTLVGMPMPKSDARGDRPTGPVHNPPRGGPDATLDQIEPPTDVMELPPELRTGAGLPSSLPPPSPPADAAPVAAKPEATMPLETEDVEYGVDVSISEPPLPPPARASSVPPPRPSSFPPPRAKSVPPPAPVAPPSSEIASPFGASAPVPAHAQATMPLTTDDIDYAQISPPATPELARKRKASKAATWILAGGITAIVAVGVVAIVWLTGSGGEDERIGEVANGSGVEAVEVEGSEGSETEAETETETEAETETETETETEAGQTRRTPRPIPASEVPGRPVDAEVDAPSLSRRAQRLPEARREREALRYRVRGARALRRGQWPLALRMYRQSLGYEPASAEAHKGYAVALYRRGRAEEAVAWMRRAIELDGSNADWFVLLGDGYRELDDEESARAAWERALEVDPNNDAARSRLR